MKKKPVLYILSNGRVAAIDKKNGQIVWEVKLKTYVKSSMITGIGQISLEGDQLFIGVGGILLCLSTRDGSLNWKNELKGWGYNFVAIVNQNSDAAAAAGAAQSASASTAALVATSAAVS